MSPNENNHWLDELLSRKLKKAGDFDFQKWQEKFPEEAEHLRHMRQPKENTKAISWSLIRRTFMKSPYTKFGTIAAGLLIAAIFLFPTKDISPNSILLADVQRKILDQRSCMITGTRILTTKEEKPQVIHLTVHKYLSLDYGYVDQTFDADGNLFISLSVHHPTNIVTVLFPQTKRYIQFAVPQKYQEKMQEITPLKLFGMFFCRCDEEELENIDIESLDMTLEGVMKSEIDGVPVVGFEISALPENISKLGFEALPIFFDMREARGYIWINPKTLLPVQLEGEVDLGKCVLTNFREMILREVDDFVGWNVEMDEGLFLPNIPEDYELFGMPEMKTTAVIGASGVAAAIPLLIFMKKRRNIGI